VGDMLSEQFSALVRSELERQGLSQGDLARLLGVPRPNVTRQLSTSGPVKSTTVCAYLVALGLDPDLRTKRKTSKPPKEGAT
jgi:hypothetical protein